MFSQFFVANLRGEPLLYRDYRGDVGKDSVDVFYREVISSHKSTQAPPCLNVGGVNFFHVRHAGLYFVLTSADGSGAFGAAAASPSYALELLCRAAAVVRDFCGVLNEEGIRRNVVLVNELVDDLIDFGYPQATSTEMLRPLVHTAPAPVTPGSASTDASDAAVVASIAGDTEATHSGMSGIAIPKLLTTLGSQSTAAAVELAQRKVGEVLEKLGGAPPSTLAVSQSMRPAGDTVVVTAEGTAVKREEVFVDLIEKLSAVFSPSGDVVSCEVTGSLCVRNFLSGQQDVIVSLNDDSVVGRHGGAGANAIEDCNFHSCVRSDTFAVDRTLRISPPPGETVAMSYRAASIDALPFRLYPFIDEASATKIVATVKVHADLPEDKHATNVSIRLSVPKCTASVFTESTAGAIEYRREDNAVVCVLAKVQGGVDFVIRAGITLDRPHTPALKKEVGPLDLSFEVPSWTATRLLIRAVTVEDRNRTVKCFRWTRTLTLSNSYVRRLA